MDIEISIVDITTDCITAHIDEPRYEGYYETVTVAEYWPDVDKCIIYNDIFDETGCYIESFDNEIYDTEECEYIKNYLKNIGKH